jgi:lipid II:glycine glycyltransferase (peptidoglycan interpeptide bridge formation enzyme)
MYIINEIEFMQWEEQWQNCQHVNLLQSWQYGDAKQNVENWVAHRFVILNENNEEIALTQILVKRISIFGSIARINRGPLIIGQNEEKQNQELKTLNAIEALIAESKNKGWRMLQIAPELNRTKVVINHLKDIGLKELSAPAWESGLLSLNKSEEELLMGLKGKWRNCLRKGWRSDISINNSCVNTQNLKKVLDSYKKLKQEKKFSGISESLLKSLALQNGNNWELNLFFANETGSDKTDEPVGSLVTVRNGDTTIYLIGTTNLKGRKMNANYILLWDAILKARSRGCKWFDIGGLNSTTPPGIAHFKKGLNARPYELAGEWRIFNFPWMRMR